MVILLKLLLIIHLSSVSLHVKCKVMSLFHKVPAHQVFIHQLVRIQLQQSASYSREKGICHGDWGHSQSLERLEKIWESEHDLLNNTDKLAHGQNQENGVGKPLLHRSSLLNTNRASDWTVEQWCRKTKVSTAVFASSIKTESHSNA